ncbi:D-alanyl-D-alanine carboxypeptidase family protein [Aquabacter spiritensis]|uniref:serine-type D-Ala-D-Ala carboxypeptidase n=1 Tax=Aquabacter spiritensis TaxID=933073 RepID=A0A4R3LQ50_9HYPH|nr:D-alanyl-D-alanine carboxypeptidase family protein [Aquabacter spiritensis]TCT02623.1 D-alanyl-D-alanine carboxypeptidase (penicillin-binding protein 5/6) [Aquabacter spiritensis]
MARAANALLSRFRVRACAFALALLVFPLLLAGARAQSAFQTAVSSAILVDFTTGAILFEKDSERQYQPGGIVKIMTALVVFDDIRSGKISPDTVFTVSENAWRRGGGPSGGAAMFAPVKASITVGDLVVGMLTVSGNDAAITLAEGVAGTEGEFSARMNAKAQELSLTGSEFRNSTGFTDPGQRSNARDMAQISRYLIRTYPGLYSMFSVPDIEWSKVKQRNRNPLLNAGVGADGLQVAWVRDAGYHLVGSAVQNNQRLIVAIMGAKSEKERLEEAKRLLEWGFHSFEHRQLFAADAEIGRAGVFGGAAGSVGLVARGPVMLLMPRNSQDKLVAKVTYTGPLHAPVTKGAEVAQLEISRGPLKVLEVPLFTAEDVPVGSLWQRAVDGAGVMVGDTARDLGQKLLAKIGK